MMRVRVGETGSMLNLTPIKMISPSYCTKAVKDEKSGMTIAKMYKNYIPPGNIKKVKHRATAEKYFAVRGICPVIILVDLMPFGRGLAPVCLPWMGALNPEEQAYAVGMYADMKNKNLKKPYSLGKEMYSYRRYNTPFVPQLF